MGMNLVNIVKRLKGLALIISLKPNGPNGVNQAPLFFYYMPPRITFPMPIVRKMRETLVHMSMRPADLHG